MPELKGRKKYYLGADEKYFKFKPSDTFDISLVNIQYPLMIILTEPTVSITKRTDISTPLIEDAGVAEVVKRVDTSASKEVVVDLILETGVA